MATNEKERWVKWAAALRKELMTSLQSSTTKSTMDIRTETGSQKSENIFTSQRFWLDCQKGKGPQGNIVTSGLLVDFDRDAKAKVLEIKVSLNETWMAILQTVLDRNARPVPKKEEVA